MKSKSYEVFVSPFKGGTTSISRALSMFGFRTAQYQVSKKFGDANIPLVPLGSVPLSLIGPINDLLDSYQSFSDIPQEVSDQVKLLLGEAMRNCMEGFDVADDYPMGHDFIHPFAKKMVFSDSKFIFVERPIDEYIESIKKHTFNSKHIHAHGKERWLFCGGPSGELLTEINYKKWKSRYLRLRDCFPKDVLIMDLADGWVPLASFFDLDVPDLQFPWENKSNQVRFEIEKCCNCGFKSNYSERHDSLYCPKCLVWLDEKCVNFCEICNSRPTRPIRMEDS